MFSYDTINSTPHDVYSDIGIGGTGYYNVFLNPGHALDNNLDTGAVNMDFNVTESELNMAIAVRVRDFLKRADCQVEIMQSHNLYGENGLPVDKSVVATANRHEPDIFVSIHCNAFDGNARGCEVPS